jgi:1-acylglycerone phosphate reductase
VSVLTIVTGGKQSAGQTYFDDLKLPECSLYKDIEDTIISRANGGDGMIRMEAEQYAKAVIDEIEKGRSGKIWYGALAEMIRQVTTATDVPLEAMICLTQNQDHCDLKC